MPRLLTGAMLLGLLTLAGCSGLSRNQCLASDWETIGYRDGVSGTDSTALMRHQDACMKHGIEADRRAYLAGWTEGVVRYCRPANGFDLGERGAAYRNVCPEALQGEFRAAYHDGRQLHIAHAEIDAVRHAITNRERRLDEIEAELAALAGNVLDESATIADRATVLLSARDLGREQAAIESELAELAAELALKEDRLEELRHQLAYAY